MMLICYALVVRGMFTTELKSFDDHRSSTSDTHFTSESFLEKIKNRKTKSFARSRKDRRRDTIICTALVISFMVFWIPFHAIHLAKYLGIPDKEVSYS